MLNFIKVACFIEESRIMKMKALGIDIGTTTISAVVMDMDTQKV